MRLIVFLILLATQIVSCGSAEPEYAPARERDGRILCAVNAASLISSDGKVQQVQPYWGGAGFIDQPATVSAGAQGSFSALVGTTPDGVIVVLKGSGTPSPVNHASFTDWINNLISLEPVEVKGLRGKVHPKAWQAMNALWPLVIPEVEKRLKKDQVLLLAGHGKGGAMAILFGVKWKMEGKPQKVEIVTFGAHMAGDVTFAEFDVDGLNLLKYVSDQDIVPLLPPDEAFIVDMQGSEFFESVFVRALDWNYNEFGNEKLVSHSTESAPRRAMVRVAERKQYLARLIDSGEKGMKTIVEAHRCDCGSPIWKLLASDVPCPQAGKP